MAKRKRSQSKGKRVQTLTHDEAKRLNIPTAELESVMEAAYLKASANGTLPAHARQIMYAARPAIMQMADRPVGKGFDQYFTQTLLPDYMEMFRTDWNVVFDARGHFHEPHTETEVPLGTLQVRSHLASVARHKIERNNAWPDSATPRRSTTG